MRKKIEVLVFIYSIVCLIVEGSENEKGKTSMKLPQGYGISAKYPADTGIEKDPAVIFVEKFEERTFEELFKRCLLYTSDAADE